MFSGGSGVCIVIGGIKVAKILNSQKKAPLLGRRLSAIWG